jgi:CDP-diacylglycerol--serine O-phosphatidyltransferase
MGFISIMTDAEVAPASMAWPMFVVALFSGLTMVTNAPFYSFKDVNFRKSVPFIAVFLIVLIFVAVSSDPPKVLFGLFVIYGLSGYAVFIWRRMQGNPVSIVQTEPDSPDDH